MTKYLRAKTNGMIFEYTERLALNPNVEVITEQEAYPERFAPVNLEKHKPTIDLSVKVETVAPPVVAPELLAEASKPFGTRNSRRITGKSTETAGLSFGEI